MPQFKKIESTIASKVSFIKANSLRYPSLNFLHPVLTFSLSILLARTNWRTKLSGMVVISVWCSNLWNGKPCKSHNPVPAAVGENFYWNQQRTSVMWCPFSWLMPNCVSSTDHNIFLVLWHTNYCLFLRFISCFSAVYLISRTCYLVVKLSLAKLLSSMCSVRGTFMYLTVKPHGKGYWKSHSSFCIRGTAVSGLVKVKLFEAIKMQEQYDQN